MLIDPVHREVQSQGEARGIFYRRGEALYGDGGAQRVISQIADRTSAPSIM
jgi:hypothetical protein